MLYADTALVAYLIDRVAGEFRFIRHPVVLMGDMIAWFERRFYADSILRGAALVAFVLSVTFVIAYGAHYVLAALSERTHPLVSVLIGGVVASTTIAAKMLYESVRVVANNPAAVRHLVSRDTEDLPPSECYKAAVESYAENLSDGVIAPLLYLTLFGLPGAFVYKAINTLDSMVGYRTPRYERFGKVAARLDDIANYIPARITAILLFWLTPKKKHRAKSTELRAPDIFKAKQSRRTAYRHASLLAVFQNAKAHPSPNAGYPIAAMAHALGVTLGGPTRYFGVLKPKAYFGVQPQKGKPPRPVTRSDIARALALQPRLDIVVLLILGIGALR